MVQPAGFTFSAGIQWTTPALATAFGLRPLVPPPRLVAVRTRDAWIRKPLGDGWHAAYRVVLQDGRPVIGELRILPTSSFSTSPGDWPERLHGLTAPVPAGGLKTALLKHVTPGTDVASGYAALRRALRTRPALRSLLEEYGLGDLTPPAPGRGGGRQGRPLKDIALVAAAYVGHIEAEHPHAVQATADEVGVRPTIVRNVLTQARALGYLTRAGRGKQGGALTDRGRNMLRTANRRRPSTKGTR